jgi:DNA-binding NarL/FixJ family response regulator
MPDADAPKGPPRGRGARVRVLVLDDCPLKRLGVVTALAEDPGLEVVAEADDCSTALERAARLRPDVVILEPDMPREQGLSAARRFAADVPGVPVLAVTAGERASDLLDAVAAGVRGYVDRWTSPEDLRAAVRAVHGGGSIIAPALAGRLMRDYVAAIRPQGPAGTGAADLSERERIVLRLLSEGHTQGEIAHEIHVSSRTVQLVVARLRQKTGLRRRSDLVRWAAEQGL